MNALDILLIAVTVLAFLFAFAAFWLAYKQKKNWGWFLGGTAFCIYILLLSNGATRFL